MKNYVIVQITAKERKSRALGALLRAAAFFCGGQLLFYKLGGEPFFMLILAVYMLPYITWQVWRARKHLQTGHELVFSPDK
jgi:hypothetical protein